MGASRFHDRNVTIPGRRTDIDSELIMTRWEARRWQTHRLYSILSQLPQNLVRAIWLARLKFGYCKPNASMISLAIVHTFVYNSKVLLA